MTAARTVSPLRMRRRSGQIVVLMLLLIPLLLVGVAWVADTALVVVTKARLQVTADRAVLAAAESLSADLNHVAESNWEIHRLFRAQVEEFARRQQKSAAAARQAVAQRQAEIDAVRATMNDVVERGYQTACQAALAVVQAETPWADLQPLYGGVRAARGEGGPRCLGGAPLFSFYDDLAKPDQFSPVHFSYVEGGSSVIDPARTKTDQAPLLRYRTKLTGPGQQVAFALRLRGPLPTGVWQDVLHPFATSDMTLELRASAAAQPYGGSIEEFAWIEADDVEEARQLAGAGEGLWYDASLVPLERLRDFDTGYRGLHYFDPEEGWSEDVGQYLH